ncbi:MAG: sugar ABC transporter permease, partial [Actinomycetota bacterium]|nr:sugar ABC transporter permease [Actinomycetota bacterium]
MAGATVKESAPARMPDDRPPHRRRRLAVTLRGENAWLGWLMVAPAVVLTVALVVYPLILGFETSIHAQAPTLNAPSKFVGAANYSDLLKDPNTVTAVTHTLSYVVIALALEIVGGLIIAVVLHRAFRGRGIVLAILIMPWALPSVVSGVLWRRIFAPDNGLLNSILVNLHVIHAPEVWMANGWAIPFITLVHVWGVLPLIALILIAGLQSIPDEVYGASAVDGANAVRQFWHITLPLLRPALAVAITIGLVQAITIFDEIYVLNGTALNTASVLMQVYN